MIDRLLRLYRRWRSPRTATDVPELIRNSNLFDATYYLQTYPDIAAAGIDPLEHFIAFGRQEGRAPSPDFDPVVYLEANPDVAQSGIDPIAHYLRHGRAEGRRAKSPQQIIAGSGLFDADYYRTAYLDVTLAGCDPFKHYIDFGRSEKRRPSLDFDPQFYLDNNPDLAAANIDPILHYIEFGRPEGRKGRGPGPNSKELPAVLTKIIESGLFDSAFYLRQNPVIRDHGMDPLFHYVVGGFTQYRDPSATFSTAKYILSNPDLKSSGLDPLSHYLEYEPAEEDAHWQQHYPVTLELMAGQAFFTRFLFSFSPEEFARKYALEAVAELVSRNPKLTIDGIQPDVSIIIPVYGQLHFVLGCLDSLCRQESRFSAEIIIVDDNSPEESQTRDLGAIPWLRYRLRESNSGFIDTCNEGGAVARGKYLIFLNSDTRVAEGWLDELAGSFQLFPRAGLIGSKLFNEDGSLQEAGGIYWRDGSAWNYGRDQDPYHPKYCFARQVDYISGASIAVASEVWRQMEGFDVTYRPAYCEDADLAFRVRDAGYQVWLQPLSCVIHYEGKTHGRDLTQGGKAYQRINSRKFKARWRATLSSHRPNGQEPDLEADRTPGDRALFIDAVVPTPDRDAGSIFTVQVIKALQALSYRVTFVPQHNYLLAKGYTHALQRLGVECLYGPLFRNITDVLDFRSDFDIVFACRVNVLAGIYDELRSRMPGVRILFENADLHYLREEREAALIGNRRKKIGAAMTKSAELELIAKADCTIVHTKVETDIIKQQLTIDSIVEFPAVYEIKPSKVPFESRHDIMFLGGFMHTPNTDAVLHFVNCIWPLLENHLPPQSRFIIVGSYPPGDILALASERIVVTGFVTDLPPYFDSARVFVAPLRYGAGIKGKVIQSLCHGTPAVMTSIAAEGIGLTSGREAIIADEDAEFAESVLTAYFDRNLWYSLQSAGYRFIQDNYSWSRCLEILRNALDTADRTWLARHDRQLRARLLELTKHLQVENDQQKVLKHYV